MIHNLVKNDFKNMFFVQLPFVLLLFQYQINWLYAESDSIIRLGLNAVIFLIAILFIYNNRNVKFVRTLLIVGFLLGGFIFGNAIMALAVALFLAYGYCVIIKSDKSFNHILRIVFVINSVVIIFQLLGVHSIFYAFQFYSDDGMTFNPFWDNGNNWIPLHQKRVSGIFPSTIYLSVFQFLIFGQLVASKTYGNKTMKTLTGFIFALTGSTVSSVLFLMSFVLLIKKRQLIFFQLGFLAGILVLFKFFREIFDYDYAFEVKVLSFYSRFISDQGSSTLTDNSLNFAVILVFIFFLILLQKRYFRNEHRFSALSLYLFLIISISPLILHPIQGDVRYWYIVGTGFAQFMVSTFSSKFGRKIGGASLPPPGQVPVS